MLNLKKEKKLDQTFSSHGLANEEQGILSEQAAKIACELATRNGTLTWAHIAVEEIAEVINAKNDSDRKKELIQLMAVCGQWVKNIERNKK